jgi:tetratricopeptide (TPR) repeat protein
MADIYLQEGQVEKARQHYLAVIMFVQTDPYPYIRVAATYAMENNWLGCEKFYQKAVELDPARGMAYYQLAMAQSKQQKWQAAAVNMSNALRASGLDTQQKQNAAFYLAGFLKEAGKISQAINVLQQILARDPSFTPARIFLQQLQGIGNRE